jgi:hypothetical protein
MDDPFDTGLEDVSKYPTCAVCRKKSDGAKKTGDVFLCGTHMDAWMTSPEWREDYVQGGPAPWDEKEYLRRLHAFVERLRTTKYASCWTQDE